MEPFMATASILPVKSPQANMPRLSDIPEARPNDLCTFTLDDMGTIRDCSRACEQIFDYMQEELVGRHISMLLPQLTNVDLVQEGGINSRLAFLCHCAVVFQARCRDGQSFISELFINRLDTHNVLVLVRNLDISGSSGGIHSVKPI